MSRPATPHHDLELLAAAEIGTVTRLPDGVITVSVGYVTLRLEAPAFGELHALLDAANARLGAGEDGPTCRTTMGIGPSAVH